MNLYTVGTKYPEFIRPGANDVRMDFDAKNLITIIFSDAAPEEKRVDAFRNTKGFGFILHYCREQILLVFKAPKFPYMTMVYRPHEAAVLSREEFMAYPAEGELGVNLFYVNSNTGELLVKRFLTGSQWCHENLIAAIKDKLTKPYDAQRDQEILAEIYQELPLAPIMIRAERSARCMLWADHSRFAIKRILINNFEKVEAYLNLDPVEDKGLHSLELRENRGVKGVNELLALISEGLDQAALQAFYEKTGLNIRLERYDNCDFKMFDRNGSYPRKFLNIWSPDFHLYAQEAGQHPEWFEPQEGADIIIRYGT